MDDEKSADPLLGEANQFLRYRSDSKNKLERQVIVTKALWSNPGWPPARLVVFEDPRVGADFRWLLAKTGAHVDLQRVRSLSQEDTGTTFKRLFGDEPLSTMWADHIAENCPGPGEVVTPQGREIYRSIVNDVQSGRFVVVENWNAALAASSGTVTPPPPARPSGPKVPTIGVLSRSAPAQDAVDPGGEIRYRVTQMGPSPNLGRIIVPSIYFKPSRPAVVTVPVGTKISYSPNYAFGEHYFSLAIDIELEGANRYLEVWEGTTEFGCGDRAGTLTAPLEVDLSGCTVEFKSEDETSTRVRMHATGSPNIQRQVVSVAELTAAPPKPPAPEKSKPPAPEKPKPPAPEKKPLPVKPAQVPSFGGLAGGPDRAKSRPWWKFW